MKFSYSNLKNAEQNGNRVGNWHGKSVFALKSTRMDSVGSGAYYILYDDENKIVAMDRYGTWYVYGVVSESGNVDEYSKPQHYVKEYESPQYYQTETHAVCGKKAAECNGTATAADLGPIGDVKLGLDIDKVLENAREMTVEFLLEGFDYGLDVAKG